MTTDDLRAKFEAWRDSLPAKHWARYDLSACKLGWDAAYASRDAEVEELRKDAERYRWLVENAETIVCHHWHWWSHDSDVTPIAERIDAGMLEDRT